MKETLNEIMTDALKGRMVTLYEYNATMTRTGNNHSNYFINNIDKEINEQYHGLHTPWNNVTIIKHSVSIIKVKGHYLPHEGTHILLDIKLGDKVLTVDIICEDNIELLD